MLRCRPSRLPVSCVRLGRVKHAARVMQNPSPTDFSICPLSRAALERIAECRENLSTCAE